jgi:hypothetical protein
MYIVKVQMEGIKTAVTGGGKQSRYGPLVRKGLLQGITEPGGINRRSHKRRDYEPIGGLQG